MSAAGDPPRAMLHELLPRALETTRLGICALTWDDQRGAYRMLYANQATADMFGCSIEEVLRTDPLSRVDLNEVPNVIALAAEQRKEATNPAIEFRIVRPDGTNVRIGSFSSQIRHAGLRYVVTFLYDLTPLEAARRAEHASDVRFRAVTEACPDGVALVQGGRVVYANGAFQSLVFPGGGVGDPLPPVLGAPATTSEPRQVQLPSGIWVEARVIEIDLPGDDEPRLLFIRDLTEQLEIQEKLIHTDRLAAVGTLAAGIAHEINNPLAYVIANLELCLDELAGSASGLTDALTPRLQAAMQGAQRVRRIVRDLRTYSRESNVGEAATVSVEAALASAVSMGGSEIARVARLERDLAPDLRVAGMPSQVEQVFLNLVLNAAQAFHSVTPDNRIQIRARAKGELVSVEIEDNGPGIPDPIRVRIFDPFFTTKPVGQGTGLGLAICRNLVRLLHGELQLTSWEPGHTVFEVTLPRADAAVRPSVPSVARHKVLVIDDEEEVLSLLADALTDSDVHTARRLDEALDLLRTKGPFDVVLCDVIMSDVRGPEVRRQALAIDPSLHERFAYMTGGYASLTAAERARCRVLEKPFELRTVRDLVRLIASTPREA